MGSTLNPGKVSEAIAALRNAALKELDKPENGTVDAGSINFDVEHRETPNRDSGENSVGAATYSGPNSPHVGNGSGGVR